MEDDSSAPAAQRVLETVELLEMVLLELPLIQLFAIPRTSKAFYATLKGSGKLRQRMFLEKAPTEATEWNPVLSTYFLRREASSGLFEAEVCPRVTNNTHLYSLIPYKSHIDRVRPHCCCSAPEHTVIHEELPTRKVLPLHQEVRESWRDMLVAHTTSKLELDAIGWSALSYRFFVPDGARMKSLGELLEWLEFVKKRPPLPI